MNAFYFGIILLVFIEFSVRMDPLLLGRALALIDGGSTQRGAARTLGIAPSTLNDAIRRYEETGSHGRRPGQGRKRCTTARDDRFMVSSVLRDRFSTAPAVVRGLHDVRGVNVSKQTVLRRLKENDIEPCRPNKVPQLTPAHKRNRLLFAQNHGNWTVEQWSDVLWSDETRVSLRDPDGRQRVFRRPNERFAPCTQVGTIAYGGGSIMVWGGVSYEAKTDLVFFQNRRLDADLYITDVLEDHVVPFAPFIGAGFKLMQDNARPHVARVVSQYLDHVGIQRLPWPALSPDLNPIEHVWDMLKRRVRSHTPAPISLHQLRAVILQAWDDIPQDDIKSIINGYPERLAAVTRARGGNTRY